MIIIENPFIRVGKVWFDTEFDSEKYENSGADYIDYIQVQKPCAGVASQEFHTLMLDLLEESDSLLTKVRDGARYKIRRAAERDNVAYDCWRRPDADIIEEFSAFYDEFSSEKRLPSLRRMVINAYAAAGLLDLSRIRDTSGNTLTWHAHIVNLGRARLLHSASQFRGISDSSIRNLIGRANRYHHWKDIERFKSDGLVTYDLGGWYEGTEDRGLLQVNRFKEEFGGTHVVEYNCTRPVTRRGRVFLLCKRAFRAIRKLRDTIQLGR